MHPDVVVDVGNTRIKWGWGPPGGPLEIASLPPDDPAAWADQLARLPAVSGPRSWAMAGVHPDRLARLRDWVEARGDRVRVITHADIRLPIDVEEPARVGIDRLLNAVAARAFYEGEAFDPGTPVVVIDIGSAMTMDVLHQGGVFRGGAILPGPWMMARALHEFTAKLPQVDPWTPGPAPAPGRNTTQAIQSGIQAAVLGAAVAFIREINGHPDAPKPAAVVTGGGREFLRRLRGAAELVALAKVPELTLDGIRLAAAGLCTTT
ncbi:MAG TPA: type III pantothenate kinase [Urbifossiella sp.]|jgi:type III pantothenate kinase|nr:type III pantothenate kinase [Urbifossiella sp.]